MSGPTTTTLILFDDLDGAQCIERVSNRLAERLIANELAERASCAHCKGSPPAGHRCPQCGRRGD